MIVNGFLVSGGMVQTVDSAPSGNRFVRGTAITQLGEIYVDDLESVSAPDDKVLINGIAHTNTGRMYVTSDAVDSPVLVDGLALRVDGAVYISPAGTVAYYANGLPVTSQGALVVNA